MKKELHISATASHYDREAKHYDRFNEVSSVSINYFLERILKKYRVETVLDLACGTGSQVFYLNDKGFEVLGSDISPKMLQIANAKKDGLDIKFIKGDMRFSKLGTFDAVITIFNAVGHLTKKDFEKSIRNIHANLKPNGMYIFDIFNLNYLLKDDNITKLTIDWQKKSGDSTAREIQYSTISPDGILSSYDIYHERIGSSKPKITNAFQTLQVYSRKQLRELLEACGFKILRQCDIDGKRFNDHKTERILTIARKY